MASISPTFTKLRGVTGGIEAVLVQWPAMGNADTGVPVQLPIMADKSCQVEGTFGGATAKLQGSNNSTTGSDGNFETLNDPSGNAISMTSAGLKQVTEATRWIGPVTSGGTGTVLTVSVLCRRSAR